MVDFLNKCLHVQGWPDCFHGYVSFNGINVWALYLSAHLRVCVCVITGATIASHTICSCVFFNFNLFVYLFDWFKMLDWV